jgi:hypothetical protein
MLKLNLVMFKKLLFAAFLPLLLHACGSDGAPDNAAKPGETPATPSKRTEIGNFEYWHHIQGDGPKVKPGEPIFYHYSISRAGRLIQGNFGQPPSGGLLTPSEQAANNPQALEEVLRIMAVGDSATVIFPMGNHPDSSLTYQVVRRSPPNFPQQ